MRYAEAAAVGAVWAGLVVMLMAHCAFEHSMLSEDTLRAEEGMAVQGACAALIFAMVCVGPLCAFCAAPRGAATWLTFCR